MSIHTHTTQLLVNSTIITPKIKSWRKACCCFVLSPQFKDIHHSAFSLIHVFSRSDFFLHYSDWVFLMMETESLWGFSPHTQTFAHGFEYTYTRKHTQAYRFTWSSSLNWKEQRWLCHLRIIYICGVKAHTAFNIFINFSKNNSRFLMDNIRHV